VAARRNQEILTTSSCKETLQPIIFGWHSTSTAASRAGLGYLEIQGSLTSSHSLEEVSRGHIHSELQLGLIRAIRHITRTETRAVHTDMDRSTIIST